MLITRRFSPVACLLALGAACDRRHADGTPPAAPSARPDGLACALLLAPSANNRHAVSLAVSNRGKSTIHLRYFHPMAFALDATVDARPVSIRIPANDSPVEPRTVRVEAGKTLTLSTPITLSFGAGSSESDQQDPHRWWIDHAPATVHLIAKRAFDNQPSLTCTGDFRADNP